MYTKMRTSSAFENGFLRFGPRDFVLGQASEGSEYFVYFGPFDVQYQGEKSGPKRERTVFKCAHKKGSGANNPFTPL